MFRKLMVANRGEIACRVMRTARELNVETLAVYSHADANALHVKMADSSVCLGAAPARESYLNIDAIISSAEQAGVDAIHPGYGFLSENANFAERCAQAGITFVGPSPAIIRLMGEKQSALDLMREAGVPILPSSLPHERSDEQLVAAAEKIGFPVMVKPNAGGGGKGMHVVADSRSLRDALASARREATSSFADQHLLIEKYLPQARHIEVQIFADSYGNVVHLFERDCSVQRRHQKVLEETPAPNISAELRKALLDAGVRAACAIDYLGAGTIEFLVKNEAFYFLEMNTRLQVEHPVTELTTGQDLVAWQLRVAAGEALPLTQNDIAHNGHALEARVYAEDPRRDFLPSTGRISRLLLPAQSPTTRIDAGVQCNDEVSIHYDPLLMKITCLGNDRRSSIAALREALHDTEVAGVKTNLSVLASLLGNVEYRAGKLSTDLFSNHLENQTQRHTDSLRTLKLSAVVFLTVTRVLSHKADTLGGPWSLGRPWRLNAVCQEVVRFRDRETTDQVNVIHQTDGYVLRDELGEARACVDSLTDNLISVRIDGKKITARIHREAEWISVRTHDDELVLTLESATGGASGRGQAGAGRLTAPLPGTVIKVLVAQGQSVTRDESLVIIEAMKMEHTVRAPHAGIVDEVFYHPGDRVEENTELVRLCSSTASEDAAK